MIGIEIVHRQPLLFRPRRIFATHADGVLALRQPVGHLLEVFCVSNLHAAEEFLHELRTDFRAVIVELHGRAQAGIARIEGDDLTFPLGMDHVGVGFELFGIDQIGIVGQLGVARRADEGEDIFPLRIGVAMLLAVPFRKIGDFGENQQRLSGSSALPL